VFDAQGAESREVRRDGVSFPFEHHRPLRIGVT
jgi:hypothetical protein